MNQPSLTVYTHTAPDFQPLVQTPHWIVALLNWSERLDWSGLGWMERHLTTDEVFVLQKGRGLLFIHDGSRMQVVDMVPGVVYNVGKGTFHGVIGTRDVQWLIVESPHDPAIPTEYRDLTPEEIQAVHACAPGWINGEVK